MPRYFEAKDLLAPPTERAAFSDRQAYVCAELSRLAYFRFEGGHTLEQALEVARDLFKNDERVKLLEEQLKLILTGGPGTEPDGRKVLATILAGAGFELVDAFSRQGTQGFICLRKVPSGSGSGDKTIAFLVFRGTELSEFADIGTDIRARLRSISVGGETFEIHSGFLEAFELVQSEIEDTLADTRYDQLILTGHSLGGALAMVATRILAPDCVGACYTFGAPPIGTIELQTTLKTPIYEIVNEVDIVPRLPNPWMASIFVFLLRLFRVLAKSITIFNALLAKGTWDKQLEDFVEAMTRYRHPGYVSYLVGSGNAARLRFNVDAFDRLKWWARMMGRRAIKGFSEMVHDHAIDLYIEKLIVHARIQYRPGHGGERARTKSSIRRSSIRGGLPMDLREAKIGVRELYLQAAALAGLGVSPASPEALMQLVERGFGKVSPDRRKDAVANLLRLVAVAVESVPKEGDQTLQENSIPKAQDKVCPVFPFD